MNRMFYVRFRLRLLPTHPSWATRTRCVRCVSPPSVCHISVPRASLCWVLLFWTPQSATAFNQPLSFDTSGVTDMNRMFHVRFRLRLLTTHPG